MSKRKQHYLGGIQSEQLKLIKIQRELEAILSNINESVNALKVEELQLKSIAVTEMKRECDIKPHTFTEFLPISSTSADVSSFELIRSHQDDDEFQDDAELVNNQNIDLESFAMGQFNVNILNDVEEEEEE